jgi:hypothetical protein
MTPSRPLRTAHRHLAALAAAGLLVACGGSDDPGPAPDDAERARAATATASSASNACAAIRPFYWEIGDAQGTRVSGSVEPAGGTTTTYEADTPMAIASATKWLYGAYVAQKRGGVLNAVDVEFLTFRSGYTSFSTCLPGQTVGACASRADNDVHTAADEGRYAYGGGHMQQHAARDGLAALDNAGLAAELRRQLGSDIALAFSQPQPAGGAVTSAADYARFLRKLLDGTLHLGTQLGTPSVCTNPRTCATAIHTPVPPDLSWHYAIGHWVEDDPAVGDGAYSSAGAFGFYPWIAADRSHYGVLARRAATGSGADSAVCGGLIRKAWTTGTAL